MDVQLVIDGVASLEEALENYGKPELLSGTNQYSCGACGQKVDAAKGLAFTELPSILNIQLKR